MRTSPGPSEGGESLTGANKGTSEECCRGASMGRKSNKQGYSLGYLIILNNTKMGRNY